MKRFKRDHVITKIATQFNLLLSLEWLTHTRNLQVICKKENLF